MKIYEGDFEFNNRVNGELQSLPPNQQHVIQRRYIEGCDNAALAREIGVTEDFARILSSIALRNLKIQVFGI